MVRLTWQADLEGVVDCRQALETSAAAATRLSGGGETQLEYVRDLLFGMRDLETDWYGSAVLPWSWFSDLDDRILEFMTYAYNYIILESIESRIDTKIWRINDRFCTVVEDPTHSLVQLRAELEQYHEQLREAGEKVHFYEQLRAPGLGGLQTLLALLAYIEFQGLEGLTGGFLRNSHYYEQALTEAQAADALQHDEYERKFLSS